MPEQGADGGGGEVVGRALVEERLHEVATLGADGPGHAHLRPPLGGEHHEDEEDQQDAGGHGEAAERREQLDEDVPGGVGGVEAVLLGRLGVEAERGDGLVERRLDGVGVATPEVSLPVFDTRTWFACAGPVEQILRGLRATCSTADRRWSCPGRQPTPATRSSTSWSPARTVMVLADRGPQLVGRVLVQQHLAGAELGDVAESPNGSARAASGANSVTRGSVRPPAACWAATGSMMAAITPSTGRTAVAASIGGHRLARREVRLGGLQAGDVSDVGVGAAGDRLVGHAQRLDHRASGPTSPSCRR